MAKTKKDERDNYSYWFDEREKWTQRALRSYQIESVPARVRKGGTDYSRKSIKCFSGKITARSLDNLYMSFPPIVDHFTKGKKEYFVTVVMRDVDYNKKAECVVFDYDVNVRCNKEYHTENYIGSANVTNCNYDMVSGVVAELITVVQQVCYNIDKYAPKAVK